MYQITTYYQYQHDKANDYQNLSRRYWYDHVIHTRNTILALLANGEDLTASVDRLIKNQDDIGTLLRPFYPADQVDNIVSLLKDHINQAAQIVTAAMAGQDINDLVQQWRANCDAILKALIDLDPAWAKTNLPMLWDEHLDLTQDEVMFRLDKNWTSDVMNFDQIMNNIQEIADTISMEIIRRFPLRFCVPVTII